MRRDARALLTFSALNLLITAVLLLSPHRGVPRAYLSAPCTKTRVEDHLDGGILRAKRTCSDEPSILILTLTRDALSWGQNDGESRRSVYDHLQMIRDTGLDLRDVSLGLLTNDEQEYHLFKEATLDVPFASTTIYLHPGYSNTSTDRENRHGNEIQHARRSEVARLRNYLMLEVLKDESHIVWFDADVYRLSPGLIQAMIAHASRPDVGAITTRCTKHGMGDYDLNAWSGRRKVPTAEQLAALDAGGDYYVPSDDEGMKHVGDLVKNASNEDLVPLDSVGATSLYIRADLVRQGIAFPSVFAVGATWQREGWDGIESEGICFLARPLGKGCFVMGGDWEVQHTDS